MLVTGVSCGVGSWALLFARLARAFCSKGKEDVVRGLGADDVVD